MPPKAKFSKSEIVEAALNIVKSRGFEALTARSLAEELGSSPRPVFTVFNSMEEVQTEVYNAARQLYENYEDEEMMGKNAFKGSGVGYIRFAAEQPKLFQLLFMNERDEVLDIFNVLQKIDGYYDKILKSVQDVYGLSEEAAKELYLHMWLYSHGIAVSLATKVCAFTPQQISEMLTEVCSSLIRKIKQEGHI